MKNDVYEKISKFVKKLKKMSKQKETYYALKNLQHENDYILYEVTKDFCDNFKGKNYIFKIITILYGINQNHISNGKSFAYSCSQLQNKISVSKSNKWSPFYNMLNCDNIDELFETMISLTYKMDKENISIDYEKLFRDLYFWNVEGTMYKESTRERWAFDFLK